MLECNLITEEIKSFISESVNHIMKQLNTFSKLAGMMSCLKTPLQFTPDCGCSLVEKLILCFTDSSPSKEDFLSLKDRPKFSYGFTSYLIYLAHYCREASSYRCTLLSSHNKLSTPNWDILRTEAYGPVLASKRVALLAQIFRIPNENVLFLWTIDHFYVLSEILKEII